MALVEEQSKREVHRGLFASTCVLSLAAAATCLAIHILSLCEVSVTTLVPGLRYWHLFVPLLLVAPPVAYYHHLRSEAWTPPHRSWPMWARIVAGGGLIYSGVTLLVVAALMKGGVPMQENGIYWLGYPDVVYRLLSAPEYRQCVIVMWQFVSAIGFTAYLILLLVAWQFRVESTNRFREVRLWHGRD